MPTLYPPRGWLTREAIRAIQEAHTELRRRRHPRTRPRRISLSAEVVDVVIYTMRMVNQRGTDRVVTMASDAADVSVSTAVYFVDAAIAVYDAFPRRILANAYMRRNGRRTTYIDDSDDDHTARRNGRRTAYIDDSDDDPITRLPRFPWE